MSSRNTQYRYRHRQSGIGLIEVILAMLIFAFAALAAGNLQTTSLGSANVANIHDDVNAFAHEMLEVLKADRDNATANVYDIAYDEASPALAVATHTTQQVSDWRARIGEQLPDGLGEIACDDESCQVSIQWRQYSVTGSNIKFFSLKTAL